MLKILNENTKQTPNTVECRSKWKKEDKNSHRHSDLEEEAYFFKIRVLALRVLSCVPALDQWDTRDMSVPLKEESIYLRDQFENWKEISTNLW